MTGVYENIFSFIEKLNECKIPYVVLRNCENILSSAFFLEGHEDLDVLCADSRSLAAALGANIFTDRNKAIRNDGTHYFVTIGDKQVSLDIRCVGDGYYWVRNLILN